MSLLWIVREHHLLLVFALQLVISLCFIYYGKNKLSYVAEIVLSVSAWLYNQADFRFEIVLCYFLEYLILKFVLVFVVFLVRYLAFYVMVVITHKEKYKLLYKILKKKKRFLRMQSKIWNRIDYGIRIKKGLPSMVNRRNARTGVYFDKDGFPKFKVIAEVKLERKYWKKDRDVHFYRASKILYERTQKSSRIAKKFSRRDIAEFKRGEVPNKYTWHHHQDKGVLQLVDNDIHSKVRHDGGFSIWGKRQ